MSKNQLSDLLLFSMEIASNPYKYRLYFVERTSMKEEPKIHRFYVNHKKIFFGFQLGSIYTITYFGNKVMAAQKTGSVQLTDEEYFSLTKLRDLTFIDKKDGQYIGLLSEDYAPSDYYYTFSVYKALVEYQPNFTFGKWVGVFLSKIGAYILALLVPILLYLLFVYSSVFYLPGDFISPSKAFAIPIAALGAIPFLFWMMSTLQTVSEVVLFNIDFMRDYLLKKYALRWAGVRKSHIIEPKQKKQILKHFYLTFGIFIAALFIAIVIL